MGPGTSILPCESEYLRLPFLHMSRYGALQERRNEWLDVNLSTESVTSEVVEWRGQTGGRSKLIGRRGT